MAQVNNVRVVHKHETAENWGKSSFIPLQGEIVVYDIDSNYSYERFKIGDGKKSVNELPFSDLNEFGRVLTEEKDGCNGIALEKSASTIKATQGALTMEGQWLRLNSISTDDIWCGNNRLSSVAEPTNEDDAATKHYVDDSTSNFITGEEIDNRLEEFVKRKNIIPYPYLIASQEISGLTITDNGDGTITINGTSTEMVSLTIATVSLVIGQEYSLSGCPKGSDGTYDTWALGLNTYKVDTGNGISFTSEVDVPEMLVQIMIGSDITCDNLLFKPQLEKGLNITPYSPYTFAYNNTAASKYDLDKVAKSIPNIENKANLDVENFYTGAYTLLSRPTSSEIDGIYVLTNVTSEDNKLVFTFGSDSGQSPLEMQILEDNLSNASKYKKYLGFRHEITKITDIDENTAAVDIKTLKDVSAKADKVDVYDLYTDKQDRIFETTQIGTDITILDNIGNSIEITNVGSPNNSVMFGKQILLPVQNIGGLSINDYDGIILSANINSHNLKLEGKQVKISSIDPIKLSSRDSDTGAEIPLGITNLATADGTDLTAAVNVEYLNTRLGEIEASLSKIIEQQQTIIEIQNSLTDTETKGSKILGSDGVYLTCLDEENTSKT